MNLDKVIDERFLTGAAKMSRIGIGVYVRGDVKVDLLRRVIVVNGRVFEGPIQQNWNRAWLWKLTGGMEKPGVEVKEGVLSVKGRKVESLVPEDISFAVMGSGR